MFDAVFIDADNTLFDFDRTEQKAIAESLGHFSLPTSAKLLSEYRRINLECWALFDAGEIRNDQIGELRWRRWLTEAVGNDSVQPQALADHYAQSLARQCEIEDGADALMQRLFSKVPVHIITNGFPTSQAHRWRLAGWQERLHGITVSATVGHKKPEPEIFHIAMQAVGVSDPGRCLMIGDNLEADVGGPQKVGMKGCWYQRGDAVNDTDIQPDYVVRHLDDIAQII